MKATFEDRESGRVLAKFETSDGQNTQLFVDVVECLNPEQCGIVFTDGNATCIKRCGETALHLMKVRVEVTPHQFDHQPTQPEDR